MIFKHVLYQQKQKQTMNKHITNLSLQTNLFYSRRALEYHVFTWQGIGMMGMIS